MVEECIEANDNTNATAVLLKANRKTDLVRVGALYTLLEEGRPTHKTGSYRKNCEEEKYASCAACLCVYVRVSASLHVLKLFLLLI